VPEATVSVGDFTLGVPARPFANLAYQLDCLSPASQIQGSCDAIRAFWKPSWTKEDDDALAVWTSVSQKYMASASLDVPVPPTAVPLPHGELEFDKMLRLAALLSSSSDDFRSNLRVLVPPQDAAQLVAAAEHFQPRFDAWWGEAGAPVAARFRVGLLGLFQHGELGAIIARAARFYAAPLPRGTSVDFDLIVLPTPSSSPRGEQIVNHGVIEITADEKPEERMDVVCHELFHFFYHSRTPVQQAALANSFDASADPVAGVAYFLLDESVATALGNGVVDHAVNPTDYARRLTRDRGFYNNHAVDATAKGLLTRTAEDPSVGPALDAPGTTAAIIAAARDAVGADPRPIEYLHSHVRVADEDWWHVVMEHTAREAHANNIYSREPLDGTDATSMVSSHPGLSAIVLVTRKRLAALGAYGDTIPASVRAAIGREAKRPGPFAYVARRSRHAMLFFLVADDAEGAARVADALFRSEAPVSGVLREGVTPVTAPRR
jgi:hypothetical protein